MGKGSASTRPTVGVTPGNQPAVAYPPAWLKLEEMLTQIATLYGTQRSYEKLVLSQGIPMGMTDTTLTPAQLAKVTRALDRIDPQPKECFRVAYELSQMLPKATYVEGFGLTLDIPLAIHHAWCLWKGAVIDLTWTRRDETKGRKSALTPSGETELTPYVVGSVPAGWAYWGLPIERAVIHKALMTNKQYGYFYTKSSYPLLG